LNKKFLARFTQARQDRKEINLKEKLKMPANSYLINISHRGHRGDRKVKLF